jgi:hypothetical protein
VIHGTRFWLSLLFVAIAVSEFASAASSPDCYDLKINARVVEQIPSEAPECSDCIIMRWPWFLDFKVKRVDEGKWTRKTLTALAVQHTYFQSRYGIWLLRKNDAGGYNVLRSDDDTKPLRCSASIKPAAAYLRPGPGRSLDEMREAGERRYGKAPR